MGVHLATLLLVGLAPMVGAVSLPPIVPTYDRGTARQWPPSWPLFTHFGAVYCANAPPSTFYYRNHVEADSLRANCYLQKNRFSEYLGRKSPNLSSVQKFVGHPLHEGMHSLGLTASLTSISSMEG